MNKEKQFYHCIDSIIETNCPFALWYMPSSESPHLIINDKEIPTIIHNPQSLTNDSGFVFAPFEPSSDTPFVLLKNEIFLQGFDSIIAFDTATLSEKHQEYSDSHTNEPCSFSDYENIINQAIQSIDYTSLYKIVLSRCINKKRRQEREQESLGKLFLSLRKHNPTTLTYLINIPNVGLWAGATPEVLLSSDEQRVQTHSLAGTQSLREDKDYCWRTKEVEEQAFVSRYIVDTLNKYGIQNYQTKGPVTLETSTVAHLQTSFTFARKSLEHHLGSFIQDLSPTPAVCGLQKDKAKEMIAKLETHQRKYYTGFLGPWQIENKDIGLFVNIRCMEIFNDMYQLYVGGGITAQSIATDEWEETNNKAQTLLKIIEEL